MSSRKFGYDAFFHPERFLAEIIRKGAQGRYVEVDQHPQIYYRATVLAVDVFGGRLENPDASGGIDHVIDGKKVTVNARHGPENPKNSLKARVLTNGLDQFVDDASLKVYWPLFPEHVSVPIKPGEHVYVTFEDIKSRHGLWVNKVPGHEGVNIATGQDFYRSADADSLSQKFPDSKDESPHPDGTDSAASESAINDLNLPKAFGDI